MDSINISNWVRSALVVDDQWREVKSLIQILNTKGVSTSYYNPHPENDKSAEYIFDTSWLDELGDTESEAVKRHIEALNQQVLDIMAYSRMEYLADESLTGYSLIFLDIDFGIEHLTDVKNQVSYAVRILKKALSEESSPYGIVLWSKEPSYPLDGEDGDAESTSQYITKMLYGDGLKGKPKPLFVVDIEKSSFVESEDYSRLIQTINEKLQADKMAKFFAHWQEEVIESTAHTYKDIQHYAETLAEESKQPLETEFFNILKHATYTYFGFSWGQDVDISDVLSRYSFSYMSSQLCDKLNSNFCQKHISGVFDDSGDVIREKSCSDGLIVKECHSKLCKILKKHGHNFEESAKKTLAEAVNKVSSKSNNIKLQSVLAKLNCRSLFDLVRSDLKDLSGLIYVASIEHKANVYLNITPPCDIAQNKKDAKIYLAGQLRKYSLYSKALENYSKKEGDRFYKTPPALFDENSYFVFQFDLRNILRTLADDEKIARYILKDSAFADLMQKFGQYNSRLGARTFQ